MCCFLKGGDVAVICCGVKSHAHQAHWACHCVGTYGPWCWIPVQVSRHHGGPHHLNGALVFGQLRGNASDYPQQAIPMQWSSDLCKPWWRCLGLAIRFYLLWHHLLSQSGLLACHLGSGCDMWLCPSLTIGHWEGPSWTSLAYSAMAALSLGWFYQSGLHDFHPIRGWDIF